MKDKKKVIIMASTFPRWENDTIPSFVEEQIEKFASHYPNVDWYILAPHHHGAAKYIKNNLYTIHRFQYFWPSKYQKLVYPSILPNLKKNKLLYLQVPFLFLSEFIALIRVVVKIHPDCIYAHWFIPQALVGGVVSALFRIPIVLTSHSSDVLIMKKIPIIGTLLTRALIRRMDTISVVSKRTLEKIKSFFNSDNWFEIFAKTKIIPMGINTRQYQNSKTSVQILKHKYDLADKTVLLFIGRLAEKKGVCYLLEAFAQLSRTHSHLALIIAGDGPLLSELKQLTYKLEIQSKVHFPGYTIGGEKLEYFQIADILIVPSIIAKSGDAEGLPVSLLEGLACGKICVATTVSGADDILINSENGFLIREKSTDDIVATVNSIIEMTDTAINSMGENAKATARDYDWDIIIKQHFDHLFNFGDNQQ